LARGKAAGHLHRVRRYGVEFNFSDASTMTKSLHVALADLNLKSAWVVYPGEECPSVHDSVEVVPLEKAVSRLPFRNPGGRRGTLPHKMYKEHAHEDCGSCPRHFA